MCPGILAWEHACQDKFTPWLKRVSAQAGGVKSKVVMKDSDHSSSFAKSVVSVRAGN